MELTQEEQLLYALMRLFNDHGLSVIALEKAKCHVPGLQHASVTRPDHVAELERMAPELDWVRKLRILLRQYGVGLPDLPPQYQAPETDDGQIEAPGETPET